jgi:CHAT domain-containing protein
MKIKGKVRRGSGTGIHYFTQEHQDKIVEYNNSTNKLERNKIYQKWIQPVFKMMVDKIVQTFRFNVLENIEYLKEDCLLYLATIINKFNSEKRAFAYFSVIIKNWFVREIKKHEQSLKREVSWEYNFEQLEHVLKTNGDEEYVKMETEQKNERIIEMLIKERKKAETPDEKRIMECIIQLFNNVEKLEIINTQSVGLYIKEYTKLPPAVITKTMKKFKNVYKEFIYSWNNGKL